MMRMRRKTKRNITKAKVVFCSRDMAARAESAGDEAEDEEEEEEERATKCPPAEYSREERAEVKGSPSIIQQDKCVVGTGQWHCRSHKGH